MRKHLLHTPKSKLLAMMAITALATGTIAGGIAFADQSDRNSAANSAEAVKSVQAAAVPAMPVNIADVVERVSPAVVTIRVEKKAAGPVLSSGKVPPQFDEFFRRFFGEDGSRQFGMPEMPQFRGEPRGPLAQGLGSGFIIEKEGLIVTNHHVIDDADEITVVLHDGKKYEAKLIGQDDKTDLALLKIDAKRDLPTVSFGSSADMRVGDWIVTIGNPLGVGKTATIGIISARDRDIGAGPFDDFLQIDAPINQGNSGGPAFNLRGEVIGVNTAIFSPSGGNVGIGFAIPSSLAETVIEDLKDDGRVQRGWLGVHIQAVTEELAASLDLEEAGGALVSRVTDDSPADKAGLKRGDVILEVNDKTVDRLKDLPRIIGSLQAGDEAEMEVWRDGRKRTIEVRIGSSPDAEPVAKAKTGDALGLGLAALDRQTRRAFGLDRDTEGVVITAIEPGSPAARKGLDRGDVIVSIAGQAVETPEDVTDAIERAGAVDRSAVLLLVERRGNERFVALPLRNA